MPFCRAADGAVAGGLDFWPDADMADGQNSREPTTRRLRLYAREVGIAIVLTLATLLVLLFFSRAESDVSALEPIPELRTPALAQ